MQPAGLPGRRTAVGPLQPHTALSHGAALPRRLDYRRAVTRVKDACGAGFAGRAKARSLTQAPARTDEAAARQRDTRASSARPASNPLNSKPHVSAGLTPT